eukprot:jgi/Pico_ML_1/52548/g3237.t1
MNTNRYLDPKYSLLQDHLRKLSFSRLLFHLRIAPSAALALLFAILASAGGLFAFFPVQCESAEAARRHVKAARRDTKCAN